MNAIKLLEDDHDRVRALFALLDATSTRAARRREQLLEQIANELRIHTTLEEEIFYPAFRQAGRSGDDEKTYFEALEEHRAAAGLVLPDLQNTKSDSDQFGGRAKVLKELIEHHADEEEREMFPRARQLMNRARLEALGADMVTRKREMQESMGATLRGLGARLVSAVTGGIGMDDGKDEARRARRATRRKAAKRPARRAKPAAARRARTGGKRATSPRARAGGKRAAVRAKRAKR
jgi:hemerythrin-like domain-containing protein